MTPYNNSQPNNAPRIAVVSTYPPTECGIASFSQSLTKALTDDGFDPAIIRLMDNGDSPSPDVVVHEHHSHTDMQLTHQVLNGYDTVILQHEFGIFGGSDGEDVIDMLDAIKVPTVVVLHTVLTQPTHHQRYVLNEILERADALVTMTQSGRNKLLSGYNVEADKVFVIAHGARPLSRIAHPSYRIRKGNRQRILTWGLLGPGKGIEWAIDALGELKEIGLNPEYVIAGQTHPQVKRQQGEDYRNSLLRRIDEHHLNDDVVFVDEYLDSHSLEKLIISADVILLPYDSVEQVTSGVLVEAVMAGKPIIATNFPHAQEMLEDNSGILVTQKDPHAIANGLRRILCNEIEASVMSKKLKEKSGSFLWSTIGQEYVQVAKNLIDERASQRQAFVAS